MSFENKSIFFFGDSNTNVGTYISYLREYFLDKKAKVHFFNNGIGGARIDMLPNIIEEELDYFKPDYAVLSYGVNDLGIWFYGKDRVLDDEDKLEIERRVNAYKENLEYCIKYLKDRKIIPIVFSPFCVDENITERESIATVDDNKEKAQLIDDDFYKRQSFININLGIKRLSKIAEEVAKKENVLYLDMFAKTHAMVDTECFFADGIHYTDKGHGVIAKIVLDFMGYDNNIEFNSLSSEINNLDSLEQDMRAYYFIKYNLLNEKEKKVPLNVLIEQLKEFKEKKGYCEGLNPAREEGFYRIVENYNGKVCDLNKLILSL